MNSLQNHTNKFSKLVQSAPTIYLDNLCEQLLNTLQKDPADNMLAQVRKRIAMFEHLCDKVVALEADLLTLVGFGEEMKLLQHTMIYCISHSSHVQYTYRVMPLLVFVLLA